MYNTKLFQKCFYFFLALCSFMFLTASITFTDTYLNKIESKYGDYAKKRLVSWLALMDSHTTIPEKEKLEKVNNFFNLLQYQTDLNHWGAKDYWATPLEFLVSGSGDCEDFSIAKYFTLLELGVDDEKLLITYVKYNGAGYDQAHMVLTYYESSTSIPLVLDNINGEILSGDKRKDLKPIYSFNGSGLWKSKQLSKGKKLGNAEELDLWSKMKDRMESGEIGKFK
jgi:predicted transglutaminase-like cysteine proteinase